MKKTAKILHEWDSHLAISSRSRGIEISRQPITLDPNRYLTENRRWVPLIIIIIIIIIKFFSARLKISTRLQIRQS